MKNGAAGSSVSESSGADTGLYDHRERHSVRLFRFLTPDPYTETALLHYASCLCTYFSQHLDGASGIRRCPHQRDSEPG